MSNTTNPVNAIRQAFIVSLERQQTEFKMPGHVEHLDVFERNLEAAQRCAAFDAAVKAASAALKTQDLMKVRALLRRAKVVYTPAVKVIRDDKLVYRPATAEITG